MKNLSRTSPHTISHNGNQAKHPESIFSWEFTPPLAIFVILTGVELVRTSTVWGPMIFADETLYRYFAQSLFTKGEYWDSHYPLFYPFILSPSYFFGNDFYRVMLIINSVVSSTLIFPTWLIARLFLTKWKSFFCVLVVIILPFTYHFPTLIMSENLFQPLLLLAIYMVLRPANKHPLMWSFVTGLLLGSLHLTRHMALTITPALIFAWWMKPLDDTDDTIFTSRKCKFFLIVLFGAVLAYSPWYIMNMSHNTPALKIVSSKFLFPIRRSFNLFAIIQFLVLTISYSVLLAGPALTFLFSSFFFLKQGITSAFNRFLYILFGIWGCLIIAVTRHHYQAAYNLTNPERFQGRYMIYLGIVFVIISFVVADKLTRQNVKLFQFITAQVVSLLVLSCTYWLVILRPIWDIAPYFYMSHIAPTGFMYNSMGGTALLLITLLVVFTIFLFSYKKKMILASYICISLIFYSWGCFSYLGSPLKLDRSMANHTGHLIKQILTMDKKPVHIYVDKTIDYSEIEVNHMDFWGLTADDFSIKAINTDKDTFENKDGIILSSHKIDNTYMFLVDQYCLDDTKYRIYRLKN